MERIAKIVTSDAGVKRDNSILNAALDEIIKGLKEVKAMRASCAKIERMGEEIALAQRVFSTRGTQLAISLGCVLERIELMD